MADSTRRMRGWLAGLAAWRGALGGDLGPGVQPGFASLSAEIASLGIEISSMISQDVMAQMPHIMEEVRRSLEEAGIDPDSVDGLSPEHAAEVRAALLEARDEMRRTLGPELKEEIRAALTQARDEIAAHRDEIAAAMQESHAGMAVAREALAAARSEMEAARARGDLKGLGPGGKIRSRFGPGHLGAVSFKQLTRPRKK